MKLSEPFWLAPYPDGIIAELVSRFNVRKQNCLIPAAHFAVANQGEFQTKFAGLNCCAKAVFSTPLGPSRATFGLWSTGGFRVGIV